MFYDEIGGYEIFWRIVLVFYCEVVFDFVMKLMYLEEDFGFVEDCFCMFFEQYWGGLMIYGDMCGYLWLCMWYMLFYIDVDVWDCWFCYMCIVVDEVQLFFLYELMLWDYLECVVYVMVNIFELFGIGVVFGGCFMFEI